MSCRLMGWLRAIAQTKGIDDTDADDSGVLTSGLDATEPFGGWTEVHWLISTEPCSFGLVFCVGFELSVLVCVALVDGTAGCRPYAVHGGTVVDVVAERFRLLDGPMTIEDG